MNVASRSLRLLVDQIEKLLKLIKTIGKKFLLAESIFMSRLELLNQCIVRSCNRVAINCATSKCFETSSSRHCCETPINLSRFDRFFEVSFACTHANRIHTEFHLIIHAVKNGI